MVDAAGKNEQITRLDVDANPLVLQISHIEKPVTPQYEADLFVVV